jgi:hypothetical protein
MNADACTSAAIYTITQRRWSAAVLFRDGGTGKSAGRAAEEPHVAMLSVTAKAS